MTNLERPVMRRTRAAFAHYRKGIVVRLEPGDLLAMRLERTRTIYRAHLTDVFRQLAQWHALAEARRKREARQRRKSGV